jgi:hypothetical protein
LRCERRFVKSVPSIAWGYFIFLNYF